MTQSAEITSKYLKPPTIEEILSFVEEVGVSFASFESYYGIPLGTIKSVKAGFKNMPRKYWFVFYERIIPSYGSFNNFQKPEKPSVSKSVSSATKRLRNMSPEEIENHNRLGKLKK